MAAAAAAAAKLFERMLAIFGMCSKIVMGRTSHPGRASQGARGARACGNAAARELCDPREMSRLRRRDRAARSRAWVERQSVHFEAMPAEDRGVVLVIFLANALVVTFLNAVLAGLVARAVYQSWRSRQLGLVGALRAAPRGPILGVVAALVCYQQAAKRLALPTMERRGLVAPHEDRPADDEPEGAASR